MTSQTLEASGFISRMARRATFSSAHLYHQPEFSHDENKRIFGRCFTEYGHGHNYILDAYISGPIDAKTGLIINLLDIDRVLLAVTDSLDHKHLNFDVPYFKDKIPTSEVVAQYCFREIKVGLKREFADMDLTLDKVRLYELDDLFVEYAE